MSLAVLAWNHNDFFNNHFPKRLNPSFFQRLLNLGKIKNQEIMGKPKTNNIVTIMMIAASDMQFLPSRVLEIKRLDETIEFVKHNKVNTRAGLPTMRYG